MWRRIVAQIPAMGKDEKFLLGIKKIENLVSKILSVGMAIVILVAGFDLGLTLVKQLLRDRIRRNKGTIRCQGADYVVYCLIDATINGFFPVLEDYDEHLEELEKAVVPSPSSQTLEKIYDIKRELLMLRRSTWPRRDAIDRLGKTQTWLGMRCAFTCATSITTRCR